MHFWSFRSRNQHKRVDTWCENIITSSHHRWLIGSFLVWKNMCFVQKNTCLRYFGRKRRSGRWSSLRIGPIRLIRSKNGQFWAKLWPKTSWSGYNHDLIWPELTCSDLIWLALTRFWTRSLNFLEGKLYKEWQSDFCIFFGPFFGPRILFFGPGSLIFP